MKYLSEFLRNVLLLSISCWFVTPLSAELSKDEQQKVLILHSYHQGLEWTDGITKGIKDVFVKSTHDYSLHFDYLDTKRSFSDDFLKRLADLYSKKTKLIEYNAIIISDNNALTFYLQNSSLFQADTPVVFCGINNYHPDMIKGFSNVTGVAENTDFKGTLDLMLNLHPNAKRITIVNDKTSTGLAVREALDKIVPEYQQRVKISFFDEIDLQNLHENLGSLGNEDLLYLLNCNRDSQGRFLSYKYSALIMRQSTDVPIYGSWDFYLGKGIIGGRIMAAFDQGKMAAEIALKILEGESVANLPVVVNPESKPYFDYNELARAGIDLGQLPDNSIIINKPEALTRWEHNLLLGVSIILLITFFVLFWLSRRSRIREQRLQQEKKVLDEHVRARTEKLTASYAQLEKEIEVRKGVESQLRESNETKDKFFSIIAHDLRNPFGGIVSMTNLLNESWKDFPEKERDEMLAQLSKQSKATYQLLQDLLTWARLKQDKIRPTLSAFRLLEIVEESLDILNSNICSKQIAIKTNLDQKKLVKTDHFILATIINNLLSNAVKFTPEGGKITISCAPQHDTLMLSIRDNGVGIDPEIADQLLAGASNKSKPGTNHEMGTGLGLVICKEFAELLGGTITLKSPGKEMGTEARIIIPDCSSTGDKQIKKP